MDRSSGSSLSTVESRNIRFLERVELRRMLDRDALRKFPSSKAIGCGYERTHYCSLLSTLSLVSFSVDCRCLGRAGRMWICPHRMFDYHEATSSRRITDHHRYESGHLSVHEFDGRSVYSRWQIMRVSQDLVPSNKEVKEALRLLDAPICPHVRLNDTCVAHSYIPDRRKLQWTSERITSDPDWRP